MSNTIREVLIDENGEKQYHCNICKKWTKYICQNISLCSAECSEKYWSLKNKKIDEGC